MNIRYPIYEGVYRILTNGMADRWYLKGIHVPVNRFGSEENKKTGIAYKPDGTCLQQTFFFTVR